MRPLMGAVMVGVLVLAVAGESPGQYGYPGGMQGYYSGYSGYYGSGYVTPPPSYGYGLGLSGYPAPVVRYNPYSTAHRPYYGAYGYGNYSNGSTDGFPPFRSLRRRYR